MRKRLEQKHKNIAVFYSLQIEKRKNIFNSQKKIREEKSDFEILNNKIEKYRCK